MNVLEFRNINKVYGNKKALNGLSFSLEENKITGLIGRNGAGKTTLLKIAAGFIRETSGEAAVFGEQPFNNLKVSANMTFIDNDMYLPAALSLDEILKTAADFYPNWDMELASRLFDYFSLPAKKSHSGLSKGMKNTFNAIMGISARCPLTIFDEPTNGMDAAVRKDFYRALLKDYIAYPRSIIISSHHLNEAEDILEDILLLKDGKELIHTSIDELREFAVAVSGREVELEKWLQGREVFHQRSAGFGKMYAVVKSEFSKEQVSSDREKGLEFTAVSIEDLCMYLTSQEKGGIDDVFNRS